MIAAIDGRRKTSARLRSAASMLPAMTSLATAASRLQTRYLTKQNLPDADAGELTGLEIVSDRVEQATVSRPAQNEHDHFPFVVQLAS